VSQFEDDMMLAQYAAIDYNEAWQTATDLAEADEPAFKAGWDAATERLVTDSVKLRADNKALLDENARLKGEIAMAETALGIKQRLEQSVTNQ
jgi:hypothetical protein